MSDFAWNLLQATANLFRPCIGRLLLSRKSVSGAAELCLFVFKLPLFGTQGIEALLVFSQTLFAGR